MFKTPKNLPTSLRNVARTYACYVVWEGRKPRIYYSWRDCYEQVNGFSNNAYKGFHSYEEAHIAFESKCSTSGLIDMDLETENRIASILLKEAAELRRQAQQEGVLAYLNKPTIRGRPNSRFLSATIRGVEQANRVVEINEMWRARQKEREMNGMPEYEKSRRSWDTDRDASRNRSKRDDLNATCSSSKRAHEENSYKEDSCLKDEELEKFLQSRVKRGRGSVGPRMDETGPYLPPLSRSHDTSCTNSDFFNDERPRRPVLGPERPTFSKRCDSSSSDESEEKVKTVKKARGSKRKHSKKHKSKDRDKKKKRRDKH